MARQRFSRRGPRDTRETARRDQHEGGEEEAKGEKKGDGSLPLVGARTWPFEYVRPEARNVVRDISRDVIDGNGDDARQRRAHGGRRDSSSRAPV